MYLFIYGLTPRVDPSVRCWHAFDDHAVSLVRRPWTTHRSEVTHKCMPISLVGGWVSPCAVSPLCCFPPVVFPPCGVWLGLCVGRVDLALAFIRWDPLLISPRASARQTRAGRCLAAAGAPQLHSPAPPQQTRRQARRPADNIF